MRVAGAARNRADMHVAVIDVPAVGTFGVAAVIVVLHGPAAKRTSPSAFLGRFNLICEMR